MKSIELFQWDLNKQVPCSFPEAHFACVGSKDALIVKVNGGNAQIPNVLLQEGKDIMCWFMEGGAVADSGRIRIITRAKPADYIYTETEAITFESLVAKVEDVIAKANTAVDRADTAASKADSSADKANAASDKAAQAEAEIKASEARRVEAEQGRAEAEATRAANESKRTKTFNTNLVSWNGKVDAACKKAADTASKAAQDAKTATDAAIAKTEEATNAAVAKADKATASATTAANKAETVVAQLPIPSGNVLKGEAESTFINLHDSWKAPILKGKVLGQSNQLTTTGKNLLGGERYVSGYNIRGFKNILKPNTKYTYSSSGITDGKAAFKLLAFNAQQSKEISLTVGYIKNASETFTTPENIGEFEELYLGGNYSEAGKKCINSHFQIEEGAKATAYEPYTGGKPSPSPEYPQEITNLNKAELVITGKNLINVSKEAVSSQCPTQPNRYKIENGVITFTSISDWGADYIFFNEANVLGVDKLTFSMKATKAIGTSNNNGAKFLCKAFDSEGNEIKVEQGLSTREYEWGYNEYYKAYCQLVPNNTLTITLRPNIAKIRFGVCFSDAQAGTNVEIRDFQIEADSKATTYEPHKSKSTVIDLKGNELLSIPNGVRDEVVIDAEGNVSLIKRVAKYVVPENVYAQDESNNFGVQLELNAVDDKYLHKQLCPENATYNQSINWLTVFKEGNNWANLQEFKQWFIGTEFYYGTKNPETIQLGKVELPALPEATSNVWNDGNIPANVYINYLKDVNIAYSDLENQIKQITAALSMIDTPTIIPEMAWGTPAAI